MKKKFPLSLLVSGVLLIFILSLLWTNPAQGLPDPKRLKGRPEQELKSPSIDDQSEDILLLVIPNWNGFSLIVYAKSNSPEKNPSLQRLTNQRVKIKSNNNRE